MVDIVKPGHGALGILNLPGMTLLALTEVTVDGTATGKTLAALLTAAGAAIHASVRRITLIPAAAGVYWAQGSAAVGVNALPAGGVELDCRAAEAALLKFIVSVGTVKMTVGQEG